jgi:hypothetical protein
MERHFQTIIVTILLALSGWVAMTTQRTSVQVATLQVEVKNMQDQLSRSYVESYRPSDAARDFQLRDLQIKRLEDRVQVLEQDQRN